ncbi:DUF930 domain-containing protein [Rhizobium sp. 2YAF20]|uniref:DUF930 domain-containing protein n=1 Tax=Rhizobium sp. 2YAF20 TaxID=3233027 RepID=UPI003F94633D
MLKSIVVSLGVACVATSAFAVDTAIEKQLQKLDPSERMEQSCDTEAMKQIADKKDGFKPDKVIAYTFSDPDMGENSIKAPGAVFRSKGDWYHLTYDCETGPQHIHVRSLSIEIGSKVPREDWGPHYLYD